MRAGWFNQPMRAVVQRVSEASVIVGAELVGAIGPGLAVLLGIAATDTDHDAVVLAAKLVGLRVFADENGRMNRSVNEIGGAVLVVSQFTLYADLARGRRPSLGGAAPPEEAAPLVERVVEEIARSGLAVATGRFGATMKVALVNDGPVTMLIEVIGGRVR